MTDWEKAWREEDTPWDKGEAAPPLREFLESPVGGWLTSGRVLVPGCGSGHDVRALAAAGAEVTGLDVSPTAIARAREIEPVGSEEYVAADLFSWRGGRFDALWEHTCFCAIEPERRPAYAEAAAELIRPGGHLVGVFFLTPWDPDEERDPPPYEADRDEITAHLSPWFTFLEGWVPDRAYPEREGREWLAAFRRR